MIDLINIERKMISAKYSGKKLKLKLYKIKYKRLKKKEENYYKNK